MNSQNELDKIKEQTTNLLILLSQLKCGNYQSEHSEQIIEHLNKIDPKFIKSCKIYYKM